MTPATEIKTGAPVPKGRRTVALLQEAIESGKSAAITQVIQLIQEITARADTISVGQLADLISRDLATMTKVLGVANTIGYNPTGAEVTTVNQAIHTIGFDKIRNLAMALLLLESAEQGSGIRERQQVAAQALASGTFAQALMEQRGGADPEQAFVCAALRNYGQLLLANFLPEDYARARQLVEEGKKTMDAACRETFGLAPLDVAYEILSLSQVAKSLLATLRPTTQDLIKSKYHTSAELLVVVSDFAAQFCDKAASKPWEGDQLKAEAARMARDFGVAVSLPEEEFETVFERAERKLNSFGQAQGLKVFSSPLIHKFCRTVGSFSGGELPKKGKPAASRTPAAVVPAASSGSNIDQWISMLGDAGSGVRPTLQNALVGVVELLFKELRLAQCVVFLRDDILPTWSARVGRGPLFESIRSQPLLSIDSRNVFTICLTRGEDVLIQAPNEPSIRKYLPDWLRSHVEGHPLLLLSLRDSDGTFGVICAVGENEKSVSLTSQLAEPLKALRSSLAGLSRSDIAA